MIIKKVFFRKIVKTFFLFLSITSLATVTSVQAGGRALHAGQLFLQALVNSTVHHRPTLDQKIVDIATHLDTLAGPPLAEAKKFVEMTKGQAKKLAHMAVANAALLNILTNPANHASRAFWITNFSRQGTKLAPESPFTITLQPLSHAPQHWVLSPLHTAIMGGDFAVPIETPDITEEDKPSRSNIPLASIIDGTVAAAAMWSLCKIKGMAFAQRLVQGGVGGGAASGSIAPFLPSLDSVALSVEKRTSLFAYHSAFIAFNLMAAIGSVQLMAAQLPAIKKMQQEAPAAFEKAFQEMKKKESIKDCLRFVGRIMRNLPTHTKAPILAIGSTGTLILALHGFTESFESLAHLYRKITFDSKALPLSESASSERLRDALFSATSLME